jgi:hypothetical protein
MSTSCSTGSTWSTSAPPSVSVLLATRAVAGADEQRAIVEDRHRQQPALEARGLLGQDLGRAQPLADAVGLAALDGVEDRPPQAVAVDAALHEVVLGAGGDRLDAALVVAVAGEHEVRDVRGRLAQALERVEPAGIGQPEIQQDAVERLAAQELESFGERLRPVHADRGRLLAQELRDQERVAVVVLDHEHANELARGQARVRGSVRRQRRQRVWTRTRRRGSLSEPSRAAAGVEERADVERLAVTAVGRDEPRAHGLRARDEVVDLR